MYFLLAVVSISIGLVKLQGLVSYQAPIGSNIQFYCNSSGYSQRGIGWYYVKTAMIPTLIWENSVWGNISFGHYNIVSDTSSVNLTIINLTNNDMNFIYFCYDKSTSTYLMFVELINPSKECSQSDVFSVYDVQLSNSALLFCTIDSNSTADDYTWIQIAPSIVLVYTNNSFTDLSYTSSYAVFDNMSYSFLYIYSSITSAYACIRTSDKLFSGLFKVTQCPAIATDSLQLNEPMGPISYLASTGSVVRLYCNITNRAIDNIVWGYVKKGSSPQNIWSYNAGFSDSNLALVYYNVVFDSYSLNLTISNITSGDLDYLYFCTDTSSNTNIVFIELVSSLSTECFQSNVLTAYSVAYGSPYTLSCNMTGLTSDSFYWIRTTQNSKILWKNGNFTDSSYTSSYNVISNSDTSYLTINNVDGKDAYACVNASNNVYLELYKLVQCQTTTLLLTSSTTANKTSTPTSSMFRTISTDIKNNTAPSTVTTTTTTTTPDTLANITITFNNSYTAFIPNETSTKISTTSVVTNNSTTKCRKRRL